MYTLTRLLPVYLYLAVINRTDRFLPQIIPYTLLVLLPTLGPPTPYTLKPRLGLGP